MMKTNNDFHEWFFSNVHAYGLEQYLELGEEVSDKRFIQLLSDEYVRNLDVLSKLPEVAVLMGFSKISAISSMAEGRSLGSIVASIGDEDLISIFVGSHYGIFEKVWQARQDEPMIVESFRVYWDNVFQRGGPELRRFIESKTKPSMGLSELLEMFSCSVSYSEMIKNIMMKY